MPYYDDDGNELDPTIPMPAMCLGCEKQDDPHELILCNLNRLDQKDEPDFNAGRLSVFTER